MDASVKKMVVAIGGSSGAIYARILLDKLHTAGQEAGEICLVMSQNARFNWEFELGNRDYLEYGFRIYETNDFMAPFASGSARFDTMIICPCSMGLLGRIAAGISDDLITRAADVILKERRRLILVPRDTPFHLIHLRNMETITLAGGIICPAIPSFYSHPKTIDDLAATVVDRVLDLAERPVQTHRWQEDQP